MSTMTVEHSTDNGRTWRTIEVKLSTPIARYLRDGPYCDGVGNSYRTPGTDPKVSDG